MIDNKKEPPTLEIWALLPTTAQPSFGCCQFPAPWYLSLVLFTHLWYRCWWLSPARCGNGKLYSGRVSTVCLALGHLGLLGPTALATGIGRVLALGLSWQPAYWGFGTKDPQGAGGRQEQAGFNSICLWLLFGISAVFLTELSAVPASLRSCSTGDRKVASLQWTGLGRSLPQKSWDRSIQGGQEPGRHPNLSIESYLYSLPTHHGCSGLRY